MKMDLSEYALIIKNPQGDVKRFKTKDKTITVGEDLTCDIRIKLQEAEKFICTITADSGKVKLVKNASANSVKVNGNEVRDRQVLRQLDEIEILGKTFIWSNDKDTEGSPCSPSKKTKYVSTTGVRPTGIKSAIAGVANQLRKRFTFSESVSVGVENAEVAAPVPKTPKIKQKLEMSGTLLLSCTPKARVDTRRKTQSAKKDNDKTVSDVYSTPKSVLSEVNRSHVSTPKSMYLIDFSTPTSIFKSNLRGGERDSPNTSKKSEFSTPVVRTPTSTKNTLLKSAIKNSSSKPTPRNIRKRLSVDFDERKGAMSAQKSLAAIEESPADIFDEETPEKASPKPEQVEEEASHSRRTKSVSPVKIFEETASTYSIPHIDEWVKSVMAANALMDQNIEICPNEKSQILSNRFSNVTNESFQNASTHQSSTCVDTSMLCVSPMSKVNVTNEGIETSSDVLSVPEKSESSLRSTRKHIGNALGYLNTSTALDVTNQAELSLDADMNETFDVDVEEYESDAMEYASLTTPNPQRTPEKPIADAENPELLSMSDAPTSKNKRIGFATPQVAARVAADVRNTIASKRDLPSRDVDRSYMLQQNLQVRMQELANESPKKEARSPIAAIPEPEIVSEASTEEESVEESQAVEEEPELVEKEPMVVEQEPKMAENQAEVVEQEPEMVNNDPEMEEKAMEVVVEPRVLENEPEVLENEPEVLENEPEVLEKEPEVLENEPEVSENEPKIVKEDLEVLKEVPEVVGETTELIDKASEGIEDVSELVEEEQEVAKEEKCNLTFSAVPNEEPEPVSEPSIVTLEEPEEETLEKFDKTVHLDVHEASEIRINLIQATPKSSVSDEEVLSASPSPTPETEAAQSEANETVNLSIVESEASFVLSSQAPEKLDESVLETPKEAEENLEASETAHMTIDDNETFQIPASPETPKTVMKTPPRVSIVEIPDTPFVAPQPPQYQESTSKLTTPKKKVSIIVIEDTPQAPRPRRELEMSVAYGLDEESSVDLGSIVNSSTFTEEEAENELENMHLEPSKGMTEFKTPQVPKKRAPRTPRTVSSKRDLSGQKLNPDFEEEISASNKIEVELRNLGKSPKFGEPESTTPQPEKRSTRQTPKRFTAVFGDAQVRPEVEEEIQEKVNAKRNLREELAEVSSEPKVSELLLTPQASVAKKAQTPMTVATEGDLKAVALKETFVQDIQARKLALETPEETVQVDIQLVVAASEDADDDDVDAELSGAFENIKEASTASKKRKLFTPNSDLVADVSDTPLNPQAAYLEDSIEAQKPKRGRRGAAMVQKKAAVEEETKMESDAEVAVELQPTKGRRQKAGEKPAKVKATRGRKAKADDVEKEGSEVTEPKKAVRGRRGKAAEAENEDTEVEKTPAKPKVARGHKAKAPEAERAEDTSGLEESVKEKPARGQKRKAPEVDKEETEAEETPVEAKPTRGRKKKISENEKEETETEEAAVKPKLARGRKKEVSETEKEETEAEKASSKPKSTRGRKKEVSETEKEETEVEETPVVAKSTRGRKKEISENEKEETETEEAPIKSKLARGRKKEVSETEKEETEAEKASSKPKSTRGRKKEVSETEKEETEVEETPAEAKPTRGRKKKEVSETEKEETETEETPAEAKPTRGRKKKADPAEPAKPKPTRGRKAKAPEAEEEGKVSDFEETAKDPIPVKPTRSRRLKAEAEPIVISDSPVSTPQRRLLRADSALGRPESTPIVPSRGKRGARLISLETSAILPNESEATLASVRSIRKAAATSRAETTRGKRGARVASTDVSAVAEASTASTRSGRGNAKKADSTAEVRARSRRGKPEVEPELVTEEEPKPKRGGRSKKVVTPTEAPSEQESTLKKTRSRKADDTQETAPETKRTGASNKSKAETSTAEVKETKGRAKKRLSEELESSKANDSKRIKTEEAPPQRALRSRARRN